MPSLLAVSPSAVNSAHVVGTCQPLDAKSVALYQSARWDTV